MFRSSRAWYTQYDPILRCFGSFVSEEIIEMFSNLGSRSHLSQEQAGKGTKE
jgi:hypothetical protein